MGGIEAASILGVHQRTLHNWDKKGLIETIRIPGNKRLYNVKKFIENKKCKEHICSNLDDLDKKERLNLCYVRVSSNNQKDDLMIQKYPNHLIIEPEEELIKDIMNVYVAKMNGLHKYRLKEEISTSSHPLLKYE